MKLSTKLQVAALVFCLIIIEYSQGVPMLSRESVREWPEGQEDPCPDDVLIFTCAFNLSASAVSWNRDNDEATIYSFVIGLHAPGVVMNSVMGAVANLTSATTTTLEINLTMFTLSANSIRCVEVVDRQPSGKGIPLNIIGPPNVTDFQVQPDLTQLRLQIERTNSGFVCEDMLTITVRDEENTQQSTIENVNSMQSRLQVNFSEGINLCQHQYSVNVMSSRNGKQVTFTSITIPSQALDRVRITTTETLPLMSDLVWVAPRNAPPENCVIMYQLTWEGGSFNTGSANTSVSHQELSQNGFTYCVNRVITIAPVTSLFGVVRNSSATTVQPVRIRDEGFQDPRNVTISSITLVQNDLNTSITWNQVARNDGIGNVMVGYSINGAECLPDMVLIPNMGLNSHTISISAQDVSTQLVACVLFQRGDCTGSDTSDSFTLSIPITEMTPATAIDSGFQVTLRKLVEDYIFINASVNPAVASITTANITASLMMRMKRDSEVNSILSMDAITSDMFTVSFVGIRSGETYQYRIQAINVTNQRPIGIVLVGSFSTSGVGVKDSTKCGTLCIALIIITVLVVTGVAIALVVIIWKMIRNKKGKRDATDMQELKNVKEDLRQTTDSIEHEQAPSGEEYAVVDMSNRKKNVPKGADSQTFYQDPNTIQHEQAPETGDLYAVTEKKGKKEPDKSEQEVAIMYSIPDKTKKKQGQVLTYAAIDVAPSGGGKPMQQPLPTEYATVIN